MVKRRVSGDDSVLLMSPQVMYGRPGPRLERIHRGEVQGILTEHSSSAWQIGEVGRLRPHGEATRNPGYEEPLHRLERLHLVCPGAVASDGGSGHLSLSC